MMRGRLAVLFAVGTLSTGLLTAAPVPRTPPADPLGNGYLGVWRKNDEPLTIDRVELNGPAEKAGLKAGDILIKVASVVPQEFDDVRAVIGSLRPGTEVPVTVRRGEQKIQVVITLGERPANFGQPRFELIEP
jgi:serine protease Do